MHVTCYEEKQRCATLQEEYSQTDELKRLAWFTYFLVFQTLPILNGSLTGISLVGAVLLEISHGIQLSFKCVFSALNVYILCILNCQIKWNNWTKCCHITCRLMFWKCTVCRPTYWTILKAVLLWEYTWSTSLELFLFSLSFNKNILKLFFLFYSRN